ncbi:hypothetical protein IEQ34_014552 [Dendrobium chrysotoxum]|uniref:Ubiquitin-like protease family profile domain-containing protein n=1 Tax=Dendrobium chrysotoxum TaxID=161865 RepID=A0AAV7G3I5_DENCH|nr:hypothetical protein IEQ34_014552 [Dendrobium chrysotoxum]
MDGSPTLGRSLMKVRRRAEVQQWAKVWGHTEVRKSLAMDRGLAMGWSRASIHQPSTRVLAQYYKKQCKIFNISQSSILFSRLAWPQLSLDLAIPLQNPKLGRRNYSVRNPDVELPPDANKIITHDIRPSYLLSLLCFNIVHIIPFTADKVALLTGLSNRGEEILWLTLPPTGVTSKDIKSKIPKPQTTRRPKPQTRIKPQSSPMSQTSPNMPMTNQLSLPKLLMIKKQHYKSCKILIHPIIDGALWTLVVGLVNERKGEFYDSVPNPMHKNITIKITIKSAPTQTNNVDCGMYICKYIKNIILQNNTNWTDSEDWQSNMPKYRAEFTYALLYASLK